MWSGTLWSCAGWWLLGSISIPVLTPSGALSHPPTLAAPFNNHALSFGWNMDLVCHLNSPWVLPPSSSTFSEGLANFFLWKGPGRSPSQVLQVIAVSHVLLCWSHHPLSRNGLGLGSAWDPCHAQVCWGLLGAFFSPLPMSDLQAQGGGVGGEPGILPFPQA